VVKGVTEPVDEEPAESELETDEDEFDGEDPDATDALEVDPVVVVVWLLRASAGSWPDMSWRKIPPVVARKTAVAAPTTRRRISRTRRRRSRRGVEGMGTASTPFFARA
jgi:hypothetical protein